MIHLHIPPRNDYLALVRRVVATSASVDAALSDRRIDDLSLAVSEACANAIDAQRAAGSPDAVEVAIDLARDRVVVTVSDHAGGFTPEDLDPLPPVASATSAASACPSCGASPSPSRSRPPRTAPPCGSRWSPPPLTSPDAAGLVIRSKPS
jgi:hypothetical protein